MVVVMFNLNNDGIDHINVYSQGNTELGRFLSNWYKYPQHVDDLGTFYSIEGLWYYLGCGDDRLKTLYGYSAKQLGRSLNRTINLSDDVFKSTIKGAIRHKIMSSHMLQTFISSKLPFTHYYVFNGKQVAGSSQWVIEYLEELRQELNDDSSIVK